jgi:hypothetical protein
MANPERVDNPLHVSLLEAGQLCLVSAVDVKGRDRQWIDHSTLIPPA